MAQFFNQATLNYNGSAINSNVITGEIVEVLAISKRAVQGSYLPGETITYVVTVVNSGTAAFTGLTLTDDLGQYSFDEDTDLTPLTYVEGSLLFYSNGTAQAAPAVDTTSGLAIGPFGVPAGGNVILIYQARANQYASPEAGSAITNQATLAGGGLSSPVTASARLATAEDAQLSISKSLSPASVPENGRITYTFLIQNSGSAALTAADSATVVDLFDPILSDIAVTFNGAAWTAPTQYTYDAATGSFATVAGQLTVPAATYTQDAETGVWAISPGVSTLVVSGTV